MQLFNPTPRTLREAVWQVIIAILIATKLKGFGRACKHAWTAFRESSATSKQRAAAAEKLLAEADGMRAHTTMDLAETIREMSINAGRNAVLTEQLKEKIAGKDQSIVLLKAQIEDLKKDERKEA